MPPLALQLTAGGICQGLLKFCLSVMLDARSGAREHAMRHRTTAALVCCGVLAAACSTTARMYPVQGPAAEAVPPRTIQASINGILGNNGSLSFNLPDGSTCEGEWSSAAGVETTVTSMGLIGRYSSVFGTGVSTRSGGGQNPGRAIAICSDGTRFDIEFVTGGGTANGFGFAEDTRGSVYRLLF